MIILLKGSKGRTEKTGDRRSEESREETTWKWSEEGRWHESEGRKVERRHDSEAKKVERRHDSGAGRGEQGNKNKTRDKTRDITKRKAEGEGKEEKGRGGTNQSTNKGLMVMLYQPRQVSHKRRWTNTQVGTMSGASLRLCKKKVSFRHTFSLCCLSVAASSPSPCLLLHHLWPPPPHFFPFIVGLFIPLLLRLLHFCHLSSDYNILTIFLPAILHPIFFSSLSPIFKSLTLCLLSFLHPIFFFSILSPIF